MNTFTIDRASFLKRMQQIARRHGGECLSKEYQNSQTKLRWRCKRGHEWEAVPNSIAPHRGHKGSWCRLCAGRLPKGEMLQQLKQIAASRGGELLSKEYRDAKTHVRWRCANGHEWRAVPDSVKQGTWCPVCGGRFQLTLGRMREQAHSFGGKCLSKEYVNAGSSLLWRCVQGHEWKAKPSHVLDGHWCPICSSGISERICRALMERLTGFPFPKSRPKWLKNKRGNQMELDGFSPSLNLAFEYQGRQHFKQVSLFHAHSGDLEKRQRDDEQKRRLCSEHGVKLLEITFHVPHEKLQDYLTTALRKLNLRVLNTAHLETGQLGVWQSKVLEEMRSVAISRGGKLLSKFYINESTKLEWVCKNGHRWKATPHNIKHYSWCPVCSLEQRAANRRTHTIEEMHQLASSKGGVCLSKNFQSCTKKLRWRCKCGYKWETIPMLVIKGHWCPKCARRVVAKKLTKTIEDVQRTAAKRGGVCLSKEYTNGQQKLIWSCSKGHKWKASANRVRSGTWCPTCARVRSRISS